MRAMTSGGCMRSVLRHFQLLELFHTHPHTGGSGEALEKLWRGTGDALERLCRAVRGAETLKGECCSFAGVENKLG